MGYAAVSAGGFEEGTGIFAGGGHLVVGEEAAVITGGRDGIARSFGVELLFQVTECLVSCGKGSSSFPRPRREVLAKESHASTFSLPSLSSR